MKKYFTAIFFLNVIILNICNPTYGFSNFANEIVVNVAQKILIVKDSLNEKEYPIAVGKSNTPTPLGDYKVINKAINPYYKKLDIKGGSEENPLGSRWISFKYQYGIHGNNNPDSIGEYASGGCIRMYERDVQEIYRVVSVDTPVKVYYDPINIVYDINGKNPIINANNDYYKKIEQYNELIINLLKKHKIYTKIQKDRLDKLFIKLKKNKTIFSDKWCFFINQIYISNNIIIKDKEKYVNKVDIEKFFDIDIYSLESINYAKFVNSRVREIVINDVKYININDIHLILNGSLIENDIEKSIYLDSYILKVNNKLFSNVVDFTTKPKVPLLRINKIFDIDINTKTKTCNLDYNYHNDIKYTIYEERPYLELNSLVELNKFTIDISTYYKTISLSINPKIIFDGKQYYGIVKDGECFIPINLFLDNDSNNDYIYYLSLLIKDDNEYIYKENNVDYIALSHVKSLFDVESNYYRTKLFLKRRK